MKQFLRIALVAATVLLVQTHAAYAWHVIGHVRCDANNNGQVDDGDLPLPGVLVTVTGTSVQFSASMNSESNGWFGFGLADAPASYTISIQVPAGATLVSPGQNPYPFTVTDAAPGVDNLVFLVSSDACTTKVCWLTGGGAKFSSITGTMVAERGPQHSFGGNVNPGCNPDSGEGGQWNHVAHATKLHFMGTAIRVIRCGNVPGIPEGSESPVTPFNFIEFEGIGTLKGIQGNKVDYGTVTFWARAEDRNEPGSSGAKDGTLIDRYYIRVTDGGGTVRLLVDDGAGAPVPITHGNLQIHISSCATQ